MQHFRGGGSKHTLTTPTYFQGSRPPTPRIYAPDYNACFARHLYNILNNLAGSDERSAWGTGIRGLMRGMATLPPPRQPGTISGQSQSWKTLM